MVKVSISILRTKTCKNTKEHSRMTIIKDLGSWHLETKENIKEILKIICLTGKENTLQANILTLEIFYKEEFKGREWWSFLKINTMMGSFS